MTRDHNLMPLAHLHHNALVLRVLRDRNLSQNGTPTGVEVLALKVGERYDIERTNHFDLEERSLFAAFTVPMTDEFTAEHRTMKGVAARVRMERSAKNEQPLPVVAALFGERIERQGAKVCR